ncbi:response regulator [Paenibacillus lycopersici]|uniref:Response regulator n=1 Tax=Paenibacillus lycopersici TaxID=2704462 RepID=A0A6C0G6I2_9BACL|nr:response regulator [Paenibacillus lycopersici]QHT61205.1 response regulator [Paenibacillus lycopersici]
MIRMYKAMLVDDEQWVVANLRSAVDWARFGFEIVGTETHSPTARERIRELRPDVVFVDIRMPVISGLELIKQCRELQPDLLFIVVSGFAEFSYVQKCLNLGAIGYCLKPVEEEELAPLLKKTKDMLDERAEKGVPSMLECLLEDSPAGLERFELLLAQAGIDPDRGMRVAATVDLEGPEPLTPYRHVKLIGRGGRSLYIAQEDPHAPLQEHLRRYAGRFAGIGLSRTVHLAEAVKAAIEEAEMAAYQYFIAGEPTVYQAGEQTGFAAFRQLSEALRKQDMSELTKLYDDYAAWFRSGAYQIKHAFFLYNTVLTAIIQAQRTDTEQLEGYLLIDYERLIERYENLGELMRDLQRMTTAYLGGMYIQGLGQIRSDAFLAVLRYVNDNYRRNLTLQMLADEFYMNRNYIGQLFIKHVSRSFTDYLAELRIRRACELLRDSNMPVHRVGEEVGYHDAYYFSKIFKKMTGRTPRAYRMNE